MASRQAEHGWAGTPLRLRQGFSWLAGVTPSHALALTVCALALLLGVAVADDYGIWGDTGDQRAIGEATLRHLAGERGLNLLWPPWNRLYGPIFETPLALIERLLGRDDSRLVFLSRHLLTHLFFVAAAFAGYLLAWRMFGSRWLALFALLLFLMHPRIYAHSFFNSKDAPFLSMFMICLWLAHRAFGPRDSSDSACPTGEGTIRAFVLCGIAAGLLTNLRIMGLAFVAVIVFARLCDAVASGTGIQRKRAIASCAMFALAAAATYCATVPYLWAEPVTRFIEVLEVLSAHPTDLFQVFQGRRMLASELPPSYLPVWFGITTPPLALLLGAVGLAALVWRIARRPFATLSRNTPLRFELLVAALFVLPVLAAVVLRPTFDSGWRYFYFLWAPFALLATAGLKVLVGGVRNTSLPFLPPLPSRPSAAVVGGLAALGLAAIAVEMVRLHPHQNLYYNKLVDRPGAFWRFRGGPTFGAQFGFAHVAEELADRGGHPDAIVNIRPYSSAVRRQFLALLGEREQRRFKFDPNADIDFYVIKHGGVGGGGATLGRDLAPVLLYERRLYGQPIVQVATPDLSRVDEATARPYRALYREVTSSAPVLSAPGGDINVYRSETAVFWVMSLCPAGGVNGRKSMILVLLDAAGDTHARHVRSNAGVRIGAACVWQALLPGTSAASIIFPRIGVLGFDAYLEGRRRRYAKLSTTLPAARSTFDVYLEDGRLFYVRTPCVPADTDAPFFVHVRPVFLGDLPSYRRQFGIYALDFRFGGFDPNWRSGLGDIFDGVCMATLELPDYPIANIATGQYAPGGAGLWRVDIAIDG